MPRLRMARDTSPCLQARAGTLQGSAHFRQPPQQQAAQNGALMAAVSRLAVHVSTCPCHHRRSPGVQGKEEAEAGVRRHDARAGAAATAALVQQQHA